MATKYYFVIFFLIIVCQTVDALDSYPWCSQLYKSSKNSTATVTQVEKISEALRESGYTTMAMVIEKHLGSINPYCCDFLFFVDRQNRITIYGNNTVTLFVPPDDAVRFENWIDLEYQIVTSKVDQQAFRSKALSEGSTLFPWSRTKERLVVDRVFDDGTVSINSVKVNTWNIYNDGHVIVHGTDDFFDHNLGVDEDENPYKGYNRNSIGHVNTDYMRVYEDPKTGSYVTRKMFVEVDDIDEDCAKLSSVQLLL